MRSLDPAEISAIANRVVAARDLFWITVKDRSNGTPATFGFSTFVRDLSVPVRDGHTGAEVSRDFHGVGRALVIGAIPLTADITVRTIEVKLPGTDALVQQVMREYDPRLAPVQIHRAFLNPETGAQLATAKPRFIGVVDTAPIRTPQKGGESEAKLRCVTTTRELTRTNPDVRSHESQLAREPGDDFYKDTSVVGEWELYWGRNAAPLPTLPSGPLAGRVYVMTRQQQGGG